MTYNVFGGTLNPAQSNPTASTATHSSFITGAVYKCVCVRARYIVWCQLATSLGIFTYKLTTCLSIGDVAGLQNAAHRGSYIGLVGLILTP